ncbi:hypothetical protein SKAU_G00251310 [Synaphobranchus kaupii]|uniref:Uncharacterized protein n=1 Tax=Synaphobranchus kaupii TaxID=118154 RepID=A0A9Q1IQZ6_SYNKA|nr:hypothetical protein SKAU_G00251310 [Synaphobranchus kaupii]
MAQGSQSRSAWTEAAQRGSATPPTMGGGQPPVTRYPRAGGIPAVPSHGPRVQVSHSALSGIPVWVKRDLHGDRKALPLI